MDIAPEIMAAAAAGRCADIARFCARAEDDNTGTWADAARQELEALGLDLADIRSALAKLPSAEAEEAEREARRAAAEEAEYRRRANPLEPDHRGL